VTNLGQRFPLHIFSDPQTRFLMDFTLQVIHLLARQIRSLEPEDPNLTRLIGLKIVIDSHQQGARAIWQRWTKD
jgi:hypothetical protein